MKLGKVSESVLKRSILKNLDQNNCKEFGMPDVDNDGGILDVPEGYMLVATTDPITTAVHNIPALAIHNVVNDMVVMGAEPKAVLLTILLSPEKRESYLKRLMEEIRIICREYGIRVLGGHTETTDAVNRPVISVTGLGWLEKEYFDTREGIRAGQDIVMTKGIGIEGTAIMAYDREKELSKRFSPSFIRQCQEFIHDISIYEDAKIAKNFCSAMHDVSDGGLFGSLWEIAEGADAGLQVELRKILIRQETIELCELFDVNPYTLLSGGTLLAVADDGEALVSHLQEKGITAAVIGKITDSKERVIVHEDEKRFLERPKAMAPTYMAGE